MKIKVKFELDLVSLMLGVIVGVAPFWVFATTPDITELKSSGTGVFAAALLAAGVELLKASNKTKKEKKKH